MQERVKRELRAAQSWFPFARSAKFAAYNVLTRRFGWHVEPEFRLLARLRRVGTAVDVGANWGQSLFALRRYAAPSDVVCFEPNPALADRLRRATAGDDRVRVEAVALGREPGRFDLHIPRYRRFVYDGLASLDAAEAGQWLDERRVARFDPAKLHVERVEVEVRTLDGYGLQPDVVKIDVQGLEHAVVSGGLETFRRCRPLTIVESPSAELVALLDGLGLAAYRWTGSALVRGDTSGLNTLFLTDERRAELSR